MAEINIADILNALNDKADRDLRNVDNTAGADTVIEYQAPTAENNYTWYRKYKSGWVEQGGITTTTVISAGYSADRTIVYPIEMADTNYSATFGITKGPFGSTRITRNTTGGTVTLYNRAGSGDHSFQALWQVSGMAA